jgi:lysophospholipase L1-like esterase
MRSSNHSGVSSVKPVRIACIGDSITEVSGYTEYLQNLLGTDYIVGNFGVSGSTALRGLYSSYMDQPAFEEAKKFAPDKVVIMIGTNDASPDVYENIGGFETDYKELIDGFLILGSKPKIWVVKPPPIFNTAFGPLNDNLIKGVIFSIERLAKELNLYVIDVYSALLNRPEYFFDDGIHPNFEGAKNIAIQVRNAITSTDT